MHLISILSPDYYWWYVFDHHQAEAMRRSYFCSVSIISRSLSAMHTGTESKMEKKRKRKKQEHIWKRCQYSQTVFVNILHLFAGASLKKADIHYPGSQTDNHRRTTSGRVIGPPKFFHNEARIFRHSVEQNPYNITNFGQGSGKVISSSYQALEAKWLGGPCQWTVQHLEGAKICQIMSYLVELITTIDAKMGQRVGEAATGSSFPICLPALPDNVDQGVWVWGKLPGLRSKKN